MPLLVMHVPPDTGMPDTEYSQFMVDDPLYAMDAEVAEMTIVGCAVVVATVIVVEPELRHKHH